MQSAARVPSLGDVIASDGSRTAADKETLMGELRAALDRGDECSVLVRLPDETMAVTVSFANGAVMRGAAPVGVKGQAPFPVLRDARLEGSATFIGEVRHHEFAGHTLVTFGPDERTYAGEMLRGCPHGSGVLTTPDIVAEGAWLNGTLHGLCSVWFDDPVAVGCDWVADVVGALEPDTELTPERVTNATQRLATGDDDGEHIVREAAERLLGAFEQRSAEQGAGDAIQRARAALGERGDAGPALRRSILIRRMHREAPDPPEPPRSTRRPVLPPIETPTPDPIDRQAAALDRINDAEGERRGREYFYCGECVRGVFCGDGVLLTPSFEYAGGFLDGQPHGQGYLFHSDSVKQGFSVRYDEGRLVRKRARAEIELASVRLEMTRMRETMSKHEAFRDLALCKACASASACVLLLPCRHQSLCTACHERYPDSCPICRAPVRQAIVALRP
jgi:hypothetical protein